MVSPKQNICFRSKTLRHDFNSALYYYQTMMHDYLRIYLFHSVVCMLKHRLHLQFGKQAKTKDGHAA